MIGLNFGLSYRTARALMMFTVTSAGDTGAANELRWAINKANGSGGGIIKFNIGSGLQTIMPNSPLPDITQQVTIDGMTQPGSPTCGPTFNLLIQITPSATFGATGDGLVFSGNSTGSTVRGLVINGFPYNGIKLTNGGNNTVTCSFLGTDPTGTMAQANGSRGILIEGASASNNGNIIGGITPGDRNIISGNAFEGVAIIPWAGFSTNGNVVEGNYIGTDFSGIVAVGNGFEGVFIFPATPGDPTAIATNNTIGSATPGAGNVISGNLNIGVNLVDPGTSGNTIIGNFVGTNAAGTAAIPNIGYGINISLGAHDNQVGGTTPAERNLVSGNTITGVEVFSLGSDRNTIEGNYIGTDLTGTLAVGNQDGGVVLQGGPQTTTVRGNVISGNIRTGIFVRDATTTGSIIMGNLIGTNATGTAALGNTGSGINIFAQASGTIVGGTTPAERNIISGNTLNGLSVSDATSGNTIKGNYIGTDVTGTLALGNQSGGLVIFSTLFGSPTVNTVSGNVVSGNVGGGIEISGFGTTGNTIIGNFVGTNAAGTAALGNTGVGIIIFAKASVNIISSNVVSGNTNDGIGITGSGTNGNIVIGNFAGTNATGTAALGNAGCGVKISNAGSGNIIGGTTPAERNILSGNLGCGVGIQNASGNTVIGNYIGLNASGNAVLGNQTSNAGIFGGGTNNRIGGTTPAERNVIAGSGVSGVRIYGLGTFGNFVTGNYIGTDANGTSIAGFGNAAYGIDVFGGANRNFIGGTVAGAGNLIGGSGQSGIRVSDVNTSANSIWGNLVGVNASSTPLPNAQNGILIDVGATGNLIGGPATGQGNVIAFNAGSGVLINSLGGNPVRGNSIYSNGALGIKYTSGGVSAPVFTSTSAVGSIYQISGTLSGTPSTTYALDFYVNAVGDPSGRGQGQTYLGAATITTDAAGNASFGPVMFPIVGGQAVLSATATDNSGIGDTSEFASNAIVILPNPTSVPPGNGGPRSGDCVTIALTAPQQTVLTGEQITLSVRLNNNCAQSLTNVVIVVQVGHPLTILSPNPNCQQVTLVAGTIGAGQQYVSSVTVSTGNAQVIPPTAVSASAGDTTIGQFASFVRPMSASSSLSAARAQTVVNVIQASWDDQNVRTASQTLTVLPNNHLPNTGEHPAVPAAFDFATTSGLLALAAFGLMGTVLVIFGLRQNNKRGV